MYVLSTNVFCLYDESFYFEEVCFNSHLYILVALKMFVLSLM